MSAWLVSKAHIDVLVEALVNEKLIPLEDADTVGRMLWGENRASLLARYDDPFDREANDAYTFDGPWHPLDDAKVAAAITCLDYQACEPGDRGPIPSGVAWGESPAFALLTALAKVIADRHGFHPRELSSWWHAERDRRGEEALSNGWWGIDNVDQAVARS